MTIDRIYLIFTLQWLVVPTFFFGSISAMQFIQR